MIPLVPLGTVASSAPTDEIVGFTIQDSFQIPVKNAEIAIYLDSDLTELISTLTTDSNGRASAVLGLGTYYCVVTHASISFVNPTTITVVEQ